MKTLRGLVLVFLWLGIPFPVHASNFRTAMASHLKQIAMTVSNYHDLYKKYPADIYDDQGKPLLSWRVRLLPFTEHRNLYEKFKLHEPWDSPHNRKLIADLPYFYINPYHDNPGTVFLVALRGPNTFFGNDKPRRKSEIHNPQAIMLVEVDAEHAPVWTKPDDLTYDPANPQKGLGQSWKTGIFRRPSSCVVFADESVRTIRQGTDPDLLRSLFTIDQRDPMPLNLPWYEAMWLTDEGNLIKGCLFLSLVFIVGGLVVLYRLVRLLPTSPGEMLIFMIGVQQVVFVLIFMLCYRYELFPTLYEGNEKQRELWAFPGLAAAFAAIVPVFWFRFIPVWRIFFVFLLVWLPLLALESWGLHQHFPVEETLTTIGHPIFYSLAGAMMARITLRHPVPAGGCGRTFWHWAGIIAAMIPLLWFSIRWTQGIVSPRDLLVRTLD
jgi:hypothetical protein